ncbi:MAG: DUF6701 domain-containing protein [Pseudomonadota bacterium]
MMRLALTATMVLLAGAQAAGAKQVCTITDLGNTVFEGVDGVDDSLVFGVGRNGAIVRYDGSTWTTQPSPTGDDLVDVHVVSSSLAFAVGDDGTALRWNGTTWTNLGTPTGNNLRGVWADGPNAAWAVGTNGTILAYDGATWSDQNGPAGAAGRAIEDAWGDANGVYALDDRGILYRFDRTGGTWDAPDTLCNVGGGFEDLWGDGTGNIFLVRRAQIYLNDGATCTLLETAPENLRGVSGSTATGEVYAVGNDGAVMYYNGAAWQESTEGSQDLRDNWVSAIGNAYFAGRSGQLTACQKVVPNVVGDWHFDDCSLDLAGSTVLDSSGNGLDGIVNGGAALETDGQLCPAVGLDGSSGYVDVDDTALLDLREGMSFAVWVRHNASAVSDWEAIFAKGDSSYRVHLNGGCGIADTLPGNTRHGITFGLNGGCGGADLNSNVVPVPGVWYHVAGTYDRSKMHIYINGALVNSADFTNAINTNNFDLFIGENSQNRSRYWDGDIDELTLWDEAITAQEVRDHRDRTRPCNNCTAAAFVVNHDNSGIHCLDEPVRVDVIDSLSGTPRIDYNAQVELDTGNGRGTWTLLSGSGAFSDATGDDGLATYSWPLGESTAQFALTYPAGPPSLNVDVFQLSDPLVRDQDAEGNLVFSPSGFTVTGAALSNPPPAIIAPFSGPRIAGTDMPLFITAYGQTATDPECGVIETYTGTRPLTFWSSYLDPGTGTVLMGVDTTPVATSEGAAAPRNVTFTNGQAALTAKYKDAGLVQLLVKDDSTTHPDLPTGIRGATSAFVSTPQQFLLTTIEDTGGNANPAAADATGPVFIAAGQPFSVTVTAVDAEGDPTPNYGRETTPESVALTPALVAPVGGNNPPLTAGTGFGAFLGGSATGTDFRWPEVGIVTLTPSVADGSYLTAGDVGGPASANVGRFIPDYFTVAANTPAFTTGCGVGGYTYLGESFDYAIAPQLTVTAQSALATVTENYTGAFFKIDNASLASRSYTAGSGTLDTAGLPATAADPAIADLGAGIGTLTFSAGTGLLFTRTAIPEAPFAADISLSIDVLDADAVAAVGNPAQFGGGGGIAFDGGAQMRYGRALLANAVGAEILDLPLPMSTEYFVDANTGFVPNVADSCTAAVPLSLGAFAGALAAGDTCVLDTGAPGISGAGCTTAGLPGVQYRSPPVAGDFNLFLAAPGVGNGGSVTVTGDAPVWLEFDWDTTLPGLEDPTGTATFGIFSGSARRIYQREVY